MAPLVRRRDFNKFLHVASGNKNLRREERGRSRGGRGKGMRGDEVLGGLEQTVTIGNAIKSGREREESA